MKKYIIVSIIVAALFVGGGIGVIIPIQKVFAAAPTCQTYNGVCQGNCNIGLQSVGALNCPSGFTCCAVVANAKCGSASGGTYSSAPSTNLCSSGTPILPVSGSGSNTGYWKWGCFGINNGTNILSPGCTANKTSIQPNTTTVTTVATTTPAVASYPFGTWTASKGTDVYYKLNLYSDAGKTLIGQAQTSATTLDFSSFSEVKYYTVAACTSTFGCSVPSAPFAVSYRSTAVATTKATVAVALPSTFTGYNVASPTVAFSKFDAVAKAVTAAKTSVAAAKLTNTTLQTAGKAVIAAGKAFDLSPTSLIKKTALRTTYRAYITAFQKAKVAVGNANSLIDAANKTMLALTGPTTSNSGTITLDSLAGTVKIDSGASSQIFALIGRPITCPPNCFDVADTVTLDSVAGTVIINPGTTGDPILSYLGQPSRDTIAQDPALLPYSHCLQSVFSGSNVWWNAEGTNAYVSSTAASCYGFSM